MIIGVVGRGTDSVLRAVQEYCRQEEHEVTSVGGDSERNSLELVDLIEKLLPLSEYEKSLTHKARPSWEGVTIHGCCVRSKRFYRGSKLLPRSCL